MSDDEEVVHKVRYERLCRCHLTPSIYALIFDLPTKIFFVSQNTGLYSHLRDAGFEDFEFLPESNPNTCRRSPLVSKLFALCSCRFHLEPGFHRFSLISEIK